MKKLLKYLLHFDLIQCKFGRKYFGGNYYLISTALPMASFWSEKILTSCQAKVLETEIY